jgi:hypothetical protein
VGIGKGSERGSGAVIQTTADLTLYVRTTGNDGNSGLTIGNALLTIQEAVDRIPKYVAHDIVIDIGEGNFAGFLVTGFTVEGAEVSFTIKGTLGNPTITTGTTSGTATGDSEYELEDSGQSWTTNDLRGYLVLVNGEYRMIRTNDATTLTLVGGFSEDPTGKDYEILEQKAVINSNGPHTTSGRVEVITNAFGYANFTLQEIKISDGVSNLYAGYTDGFTTTRCAITGGTYGINFINSRKGFQFLDVYLEDNADGAIFYKVDSIDFINNFYIYNSTSNGCAFQNTNVPDCTFLVVDDSTEVGVICNAVERGAFTNLQLANNKKNLEIMFSHSIWLYDPWIEYATEYGILIYDSISVEITGGTYWYGWIHDNGTYGIELNKDIVTDRTASGKLHIYGDVYIDTNGSGGIIARNNAFVVMSDVYGLNTGAYGLELETGSIGVFTAVMDIRGATADATIDGGTTDLDWSTDFPSDGDSVTNISNMCMIERKD